MQRDLEACRNVHVIAIWMDFGLGNAFSVEAWYLIFEEMKNDAKATKRKLKIVFLIYNTISIYMINISSLELTHGSRSVYANISCNYWYVDCGWWQVSTRFLSASPLVYWFASYVIGHPGIGKRLGHFIWAYCAAYIFLGSLLFSNFYPFTWTSLLFDPQKRSTRIPLNWYHTMKMEHFEADLVCVF